MCKKRNSTTKPNLNPISFFSSPTILCFQICMVILCGKLSLSHNLPQIVRQSRYPKNEPVCKKMLHSKHFSKCIKVTTRKLGSFCFGFSFLLVLLFTSSEILFITVFISIVIRSNYMILFKTLWSPGLFVHSIILSLLCKPTRFNSVTISRYQVSSLSDRPKWDIPPRRLISRLHLPSLPEMISKFNF